MPLLDQLTASGKAPGQQRKIADFFRDHPGLADEVRACRAAGFSWPQIASQIHADHQMRLSTTALADFIQGRQ